MANHGNEVKEDCSICSEKLQEGYLAPCNHEFCLSCILAWSNTLNAVNAPTNCPMCRTNLDRQAIMDLHAVRLRNENQERLLSLQDFLRLRGVSLQPRGYQLVIKPDNEWLANLNSVITLMKKGRDSRNPINRLNIENLLLKINDKNLVFETPLFKCRFHDGLNEQFNTGPYLLATSANNDFSVFEQLDEVLKDYLNEPGATYGYLLKKPRNPELNSTSCMKFQLGTLKDTPNNVLDSSLFTNSNNDDPNVIIHQLKNKGKYNCRILFTINFIKVGDMRTVYPKMKVVYLKCDEVEEPKYSFLGEN